MNLDPMSFEEFLMALKVDILLQRLQTFGLRDGIDRIAHQRLTGTLKSLFVFAEAHGSSQVVRFDLNVSSTQTVTHTIKGTKTSVVKVNLISLPLYAMSQLGRILRNAPPLQNIKVAWRNIRLFIEVYRGRFGRRIKVLNCKAFFVNSVECAFLF